MFFVAILTVCETTDISSCRTLVFPEAFISSAECSDKLGEGIGVFTSQGLYTSATCKGLEIPGEPA